MHLHFTTIGQGPDLVILHGLFGSGDNWRLVADALSESFRVSSVDLRNHGRSPHADSMTYEEMAQDLLNVVTALGQGTVHVLGHSLGGKVAMHFALQHPTIVRSLVVVDMSPAAQPERHRGILQALQALDPARHETRQQMEAELAAGIADLAVRRFLLKSLERDSTGRYQWRLNLRAIHENYLELNAPVDSANPFSGSTLFVYGGKSDYVQASDRAQILQLFPSAACERIEEAGHWLHAEAPAEFLRILHGFYASMGSREKS